MADQPNSRMVDQIYASAIGRVGGGGGGVC